MLHAFNSFIYPLLPLFLLSQQQPTTPSRHIFLQLTHPLIYNLYFSPQHTHYLPQNTRVARDISDKVGLKLAFNYCSC